MNYVDQCPLFLKPIHRKQSYWPIDNSYMKCTSDWRTTTPSTTNATQSCIRCRDTASSHRRYGGYISVRDVGGRTREVEHQSDRARPLRGCDNSCRCSCSHRGGRAAGGGVVGDTADTTTSIHSAEIGIFQCIDQLRRAPARGNKVLKGAERDEDVADGSAKGETGEGRGAERRGHAGQARGGGRADQGLVGG